MAKVVSKFSDRIITNSDADPKTYASIYNIHKYWAKKPFNLINEYIKKYSNKNNIVLDSFCGSGITLIEANNLKRKSIGIDINPIAFYLSKIILTPVEIGKVEKEFLKIENDCKNKINSFYEIKRKKDTHIGTHFVWLNGKLDEVRYQNGRMVSLKPNLSDKRLANSFQYSKIRNYFPKDRLFDNTRINSDSKLRVYELFTPRNTNALAILLNRIDQIKDKKTRDLFRLCFSSTLGQTSKMVFVNNAMITKEGKKKHKQRRIGSWVIGYWVPKEHFELNVWNSFVTRYTKILNAKKLQQDNLSSPTFVKNFKDLKNGNVWLMNTSALKGLKKIPTNSIDYIITDPPHGDRVPYLELSHMWNSWLKNKVDFKNEIIISGAKQRNKDVSNYLKLFEETIAELSRVLKFNHYFTLLFNTHSERTWQEIFNFAKIHNLKIHDISTLNYSHNSVVQEHKESGLRFDFVLTFKKIKSTH